MGAFKKIQLLVNTGRNALADALEDQVDRDGQVEVRGRLVENSRERRDGGEVDVGCKRKVFSGRVRI